MYRYTRGILPKIRSPNPIFTFDTENSTGFFDENCVLYKTPSWIEKDSFFDNKKCISLMYIWQFGINERIYYGRTLDELKDFIEELNEKNPYKKYVFVHNLSHDFQFLLNIIQFTSDNVFARKPYQIIKATADEYNMEFRCTFFLTRLSLADWGKKIGLQKMVGDLDYTRIYTPATPLTETELNYCSRDCEVIYKGIRAFLEKYGTLEKIPLTQTGETRLEYKKRIKNNVALHRTLQGLVPTEEQYTILKKVYRGGDTHANYLHVGKIIKNVHSYDITSSYPFVMISELYPSTPWRKMSGRKISIDKLDVKKYGYMLKIRINKLEEKHSCHYISISKTEKCECFEKEETPVIDNGRVLSADVVEMWVNELDLDIIMKTYLYDSIEVLEGWESRKKRLNKEMIQFVIELFTNKTQYKDVDGFENIYMQAKQYLNALYGMCVSDIINNDIVFNQTDTDNPYITLQADYDNSVKPLLEKEYKNFLSYTHGVWVASYARYNLWTAIIAIGDDVVYYDTDSVKYIGDHTAFFDEYNKKALEKGMAGTEIYGLSPTAIMPNGEKTTLGLFMYEGTYTEFKTLGAKRYAYKIPNKKGELETHITVSGVRKSASVYLKDNLDNFKDEMRFPRHLSGKKIAVRNFNQQPTDWIDECGNTYHSNQKFGSALRESSYNLNLTDEFTTLLGLINI